VRMDSRAFRLWSAKKQKRKYISGISAMSASQILVPYSHPTLPFVCASALSTSIHVSFVEKWA